jgi:hypothetical protein
LPTIFTVARISSSTSVIEAAPGDPVGQARARRKAELGGTFGIAVLDVHVRRNQPAPLRELVLDEVRDERIERDLVRIGRVGDPGLAREREQVGPRSGVEVSTARDRAALREVRVAKHNGPGALLAHHGLGRCDPRRVLAPGVEVVRRRDRTERTPHAVAYRSADRVGGVAPDRADHGDRVARGPDLVGDTRKLAGEPHVLAQLRGLGGADVVRMPSRCASSRPTIDLHDLRDHLHTARAQHREQRKHRRGLGFQQIHPRVLLLDRVHHLRHELTTGNNDLGVVADLPARELIEPLVRNRVPCVVAVTMHDHGRSEPERRTIRSQLHATGPKPLEQARARPRQRELDVVVAEHQRQLAPALDQVRQRRPHLRRPPEDLVELVARVLVRRGEARIRRLGEEVDDVSGEHEVYVDVLRMLPGERRDQRGERSLVARRTHLEAHISTEMQVRQNECSLQ